MTEPAGKDYQRTVMSASLAIAFLMLGGKYVAYSITGSSAILSDALESVVHLFATGFAAFSFWYAVRPPDDEHPYGHGKIAYFSSGFEGGLIMVAAFLIIATSVQALITGPELARLDIGLAITGGLMLINLALGSSLVLVGKRHDNLVLMANGRHVLTDMWTSLGVLVGVALVYLTGITWIDPVAAILVGLNILWTAFGLMRNAVQGLMDKVDPVVTAAILKALDEAVAQGVTLGHHKVRHRLVNSTYWVDYHIQFPDALSITEAHARAHRIEDTVKALFEGRPVIVTAHLEPEGSLR